MMVLVKNLNGTSDNTPSGYSSWKEFWVKKSGKLWPTYCAASNCFEIATVGGHVKKVGSTDNSWYIVPLCSKHNNDHDSTFYVDDSMLVPVR